MTTDVATIAEDMTLVALTPSDMVPAQRQLTEWCERKIAAVRAELADLQENLRIAIASKWRHSALKSAVHRTAKRVTYYEKMKAAVDAGYLIVPNFPVNLFAVRVARESPRHAETDSHWRSLNADAELLPVGEGRYVDEHLPKTDASYQEQVDGKTKDITRYVSGEYADVDFPAVAVKPTVLDATQRAMALRIFDQLGIVRNTSGRDPIVVGQLIDPRGNGRLTTFFVAWWLDTNTL